MIKVLEAWVADKIAAGEVIERPLSIVKEIVENSIDAGSSSIIIEIRNGGKSYIRVTDNGCGIEQDEIETAFLRHATSKISSVNDLEAVRTLGFRGEALASIAAISRLTIVSRTADASNGTKLVIHGGQLVSKTSVGANKGTTIIVQDVFYNTPARRKFMKSDAREASAIIEFIESIAVYYADIKFMLVNNGKTVVNTSGDGKVNNVISEVFPSQDFKNLIEIDNNNIRAYISDPGTTRPNRKGQLFYVNGRLVNSKVIEEGITKGYGDRIFSGYPIAIVFIDIDPAEIDVNIHPGKKEIKFADGKKMSDSIADAIADAMQSEQSIPTAAGALKPSSHNIVSSNEQLRSGFAGELRESRNEEALPFEAEEQIDVRSFLSSIERDAFSERTINDEADTFGTALSEEESVSEMYSSKSEHNRSGNSCNFDIKTPVSSTPYATLDWSSLRQAGYIMSTYIIMENRDAVYIIDQHAAHERVFYEKLLKAYSADEHQTQPILSPFIIDTSQDVYNSDRDWMDKLRAFGYEIEDFGTGSFVIKGIPTFMSITEANRFAEEFISMLGEYSSNSVVVDKLITKSCKSAVKAGDNLSKDEITELVNELSRCNNPYSCPHGRPTLVKLTQYEIEKMFKRK